MIKLELTDAETQALLGLLDAGVRQTGLRAAKDAAVLTMKIEEAVKASGEAKPAANGEDLYG